MTSPLSTKPTRNDPPQSNDSHNGVTRSKGKNPVSRKEATGQQIVPARVGDHVSVFQLLQTVMHGPSAAEFQAIQDDPLYEPSDRLLLRDSGRLLGHVLTTKRSMYFGRLQMPAATLQELCVLPEFRRQGLASQLLAAAEANMRQNGAQIGLLRTTIPSFFTGFGWVVCGRHCYSNASARDILAHLSSQDPPPSLPGQSVQPPLNIRLWRQVEQDALCDLYAGNCQSAYGPLLRNEAYWRWLVSRHGYDRIYVAIDGHDKLELDDCSRIVGYAVVDGQRISEIMAATEHPSAYLQLLKRACGDAIERDVNSLRLDAPPRHPLHQVMRQAGGKFYCHEAEQGDVFMAKVFEPLELLDQLRETIFTRAKEAKLDLPLDVGLCVEGEKHLLSFTRRSAKLSSGRLGRSYLTCGGGELTQLLLGHTNVAEAADAERIEASTRVAIEVGTRLFPKLPFWRSPLDDTPAK